MSGKRRKLTEEEEDPILEDIPIPSSSKRSKTKRSKKPKRVSLKSKLLRELRKRQREHKSKLRSIQRDINSLICKRKKPQ